MNPTLRPLGRDRELRRVLFFGKSMSRTRCSGALVRALREHGLEVRWRNLATLRRWTGQANTLRLVRWEFQRYQPDLVFVFFRDLPYVLLEEFRAHARVVIWCEEALEDLDRSIFDYFALADLVCMSNPSRFSVLREHGLDNMLFAMSGFSPDFHRPAAPRAPRRDVAFIGGPGRHGQRAAFLHHISQHFDTEIFGLNWDRWRSVYPGLRVRGQVTPRSYAKVCASSRIVLGMNEVNGDAFYFSNRTFLTLACGGFHLTHYVPQLERVFRDGEHLAWFTDRDDAVEKIRHWLPRDEQRAQIAAAGHDLVLKHHRYSHRITRVLQVLREGLPEDPTALLALPSREHGAVAGSD